MPDVQIGHLISAELVRALKTVFPLRPPRLDMHDRQVWMEAGEQRVIEFLETQHQRAVIQPILSE